MSSLASSETTQSSLNSKPYTKYAQTNLQLFNQLCSEGYSSTELSLIFSAYQLATSIYTGWLRPSGKTFIAHLVGTASILSSLHAPAPVVAAGLLHAAYFSGNLAGKKKRGISEAKRKQLMIQTVGSEVEAYITRYTDMKWNKQTIPTIYANLDSLDPIDRDVVLMRLANELEEYLDFGLLYCAQAKQEKYTNHSDHLVVEIAEKLGFPSLAVELKTMYKETATAKIPLELRNHGGQKSTLLLVPHGKKQLLGALKNIIVRNLGRLRFSG